MKYLLQHVPAGYFILNYIGTCAQYILQAVQTFIPRITALSSRPKADPNFEMRASNSEPARRPSSSASQRPLSAVSLRPPSGLSQRPSSSLSVRPTSRVSNRPSSRLSTRPGTGHRPNPRIGPLSQDLVTQITGLVPNGDEEKNFETAVDFVTKNLEYKAKGGVSQDITAMDRVFSGYVHYSVLQSRLINFIPVTPRKPV